ncbi:MAG: hypothetical protein KC619_35350 [Myxococcales bacterium]|nr:hypothetical protein [Myxococcales bacterium]
MKRKLLIVLLGFGTLFGFGSGFASMSYHWHQHAEARRAAWEAHVADVCVEAAQRADRPDPRDDRWGPPPSDYPEWDGPPPERHHRPHRHHQPRW